MAGHDTATPLPDWLRRPFNVLPAQPALVRRCEIDRTDPATEHCNRVNLDICASHARADDRCQGVHLDLAGRTLGRHERRR